LGDAPDAAVGPAALAAPDRQRRAPVPVPGQRPVHVVLEPVLEPVRADLLGMPGDFAIRLEHPVAIAGRGEVPSLPGVIEKRRVAPPAEGIAVRRRLLAIEEAMSLQP